MVWISSLLLSWIFSRSNFLSNLSCPSDWLGNNYHIRVEIWWRDVVRLMTFSLRQETHVYKRGFPPELRIRPTAHFLLVRKSSKNELLVMISFLLKKSTWWNYLLWHRCPWLKVHFTPAPCPWSFILSFPPLSPFPFPSSFCSSSPSLPPFLVPIHPSVFGMILSKLNPPTRQCRHAFVSFCFHFCWLGKKTLSFPHCSGALK